MCCFSGNRFNILPCSVSNLVLYWGHHSLVVLTQSGFQGGDVCLSTIQWATEAALHLEFQRTQGPLGTVEHRMFSLYFLSLSLWLWSPKLISMFETKAEINSKPRQCKITLGYWFVLFFFSLCLLAWLCSEAKIVNTLLVITEGGQFIVKWGYNSRAPNPFLIFRNFSPGTGT